MMEENLEKLRKIGIKEIANQTKISTSRIQDILDNNFQNIQRVHLVGFLQILEREYKLDLSDILKAFDEYHNKQTSQEPEKVEVRDLSLDTQKQRYDTIDERKKQANSKQKFYFTLVCVVVVILIYLLYQNIASKYTKEMPAEESKSPTIIIENGENEETIIIDDATSSNIQSDTPQEQESQNSTQIPDENVLDVSVQDITDSTQNSESNTTSVSDQAPQNNTEAKSKNMLISTDVMLWFDIVDLDTNRRKYQGVTSTTYSIKTDNHRWLLAFGHSNFNLTMNGEPFTFEKGNYPLYFIYEPDNGFRKIDPQTYRRLSEQAR